MFIESDMVPGTVELDEEALHAFVSYIVASNDDIERRAFVANAFLAAATYDPDLSKVVMFAVGSAIVDGVDATIKILGDDLDLRTGVDRVERALAEGVL